MRLPIEVLLLIDALPPIAWYVLGCAHGVLAALHLPTVVGRAAGAWRRWRARSHQTAWN